MIFLVWIASIFLAAVLAAEKQRNSAGWVILSIFTGPLAVIIVALLPSLKGQTSRVPAKYGSGLTGASLKLDLEEVKKDFQRLGSRLNDLEVKINVLRGNELPVAPSPIPVQQPQEVSSQEIENKPSLQEELSGSKAQRKDLETDLGKFWLNKIGIIIFTLGVGFLITYAFKYFGALLRVVFGYAVCCVLFFLGDHFEKKERFLYFGRVLLGGAWALVYFTTYAMYHFEASRIITSQPLELFLLAIVAAGIISYSLRYRSEVLTAIAFFIGYLTSTLGDINNFTLISSLLLSLALLFVVYRLQWFRFIFLGIVLTYLTHLGWVVKHIAFSTVAAGPMNLENVLFFLDAGFLSVYWVLFLISVHVIRDKAQETKLSAANFSNFSLYFLMIFPKLYVFYPAQKFNFVLGLGAVYLACSVLCEMSGRKKLFISNIVIAVALLTMAVPLKFLPYHTAVIWFIELPFLLFIGLAFSRPVYRYLSLALAFVLFYKVYFMSSPGFTGMVVFNKQISWFEFLSFAGAVSTAVSYSLYWFWKKRSDFGKELNLANLFSGFAIIYLTRFLWEFSPDRWLSFNLFAEALLALVCGALLLDKYLRIYGLAVLLMASFRFCFLDNYASTSESFQAFMVLSKIVFAFLCYAVYRVLGRKNIVLDRESRLGKFIFFVAASLAVFSIFSYVLPRWITLSLEAGALAALVWGVKSREQGVRYYSLLVFLIAGIRFCVIDNLSWRPRSPEWWLIGLILAIGYCAYAVYKVMKNKSLLEAGEEIIPEVLFYGATFLTVFSIFRYIKVIWISMSLGVVGVALFTLGFLFKDKTFRLGGFIIFAITLCRVVFVDLSGLTIIYKIISFIILGILFLGVSYFYTRYNIGKQEK